MKTLWKASLATTLVAAGALLVAPSAQAADATCVGDLGDETFTGTLTVGAGDDCILGGATVEGDVVVEPGGFLDATSATITGDVIATDPYGVRIDGTSVGGDVSVFSDDQRFGFLYLYDLEVGGGVAAGGVDVEISDSSIAGNLDTDAANYVDVLRTSVTGDLNLIGSDYGVTLAGGIVHGSATVSGSGRDVLIGATPNGSAEAWGNSIAGDLTVSGNDGNVRVAGTAVYGTASFTDNTPAAQLGAGNTAGAVEGDYTGDEPGVAVAGDQNVSITVPNQAAGELAWALEGTSSVVDLGVAEEELDHFAATGSIVPVRVIDTRAGSPAWSVTAQVSDFAASGESLSSSLLGWAPELGENAGGATAGAAIASGFDEGDGLSVARTLVSAEEGHARGAAVAGAQLDLKLPLDTPTGTYTATVTLTALS